jgi:hypothetical protein
MSESLLRETPDKIVAAEIQIVPPTALHTTEIFHKHHRQPSDWIVIEVKASRREKPPPDRKRGVTRRIRLILDKLCERVHKTELMPSFYVVKGLPEGH